MKKITIFLKTLVILPILMLSSCQNEATQLLQDSNSTTDQKTGSPTEEELLKQGWKLVQVIKPDIPLSKTSTSAESSVPDPIPLTQAHLKDLGYDINFAPGRNSIKGAFAIDDIVPDGIWFNSGLLVDGNTDNYAGSHDPDAKIILGTPQLSNQEESSLPDDVYTTIATNNSDKETEITVKYTYKEGYKSTWQRKVSGSFKLGIKVGFKFADTVSGEVSSEITVGGETTDGTENSNETTKESAYKVTVPAHSQVKVNVFTKMRNTTVKYTIPYSISGLVRTNFYKPVQGHYFHAMDITQYPKFKPTITNEMGSTKVIKYLEVHVVNSQPEKLQ